MNIKQQISGSEHPAISIRKHRAASIQQYPKASHKQRPASSNFPSIPSSSCVSRVFSILSVSNAAGIAHVAIAPKFHSVSNFAVSRIKKCRAAPSSINSVETSSSVKQYQCV
jgi:hypothetical protein